MNSNQWFALCMCAKCQNRGFQTITFSKALIDKLVGKEIKRVPTYTTISAIPTQKMDKSKLLFFLPAVLRHNNNDNNNCTAIVIIKIGNCGCHLLRSCDINNCENPFSPQCHATSSDVDRFKSKHQQSHFTVITIYTEHCRQRLYFQSPFVNSSPASKKKYD